MFEAATTSRASSPFLRSRRAPSFRELALGAVVLLNALMIVALLHDRASQPQAQANGFPSVEAAAAVSASGSLAPFGTTNRTVIVTGSSAGIGKGIVQLFAKAGARVIVNSRHLDQAQEVVDLIVAAGGVASAFAGDVSIEKDMIKLAQFAVERYGGIDVLIANAGVYPSKPLENMSLDDWDRVLNINLRGSFLGTKSVLPYLKRSPFGRIILTSSITGPITGYPGWSHYGASKAGQLGFMRTAAVELAKHQITINAVLPGNILVDRLAALGAEYVENSKATIPLGRLGTVEDIGNACLFLASKEAGWITGQTLVIDGGQTLPENPDFSKVW